MSPHKLVLLLVLAFLGLDRSDAFKGVSSLHRCNTQVKHLSYKSPVVYKNRNTKLHVTSEVDNDPTTNPNQGYDNDPTTNPNRLAYGLLWSGLLAYVVLAAPGGSPEAKLMDTDLIMKMISTPFDGTTNAIFVALFNSLGIVPAVYASLLLPGSKDQKVPALPFVIGTFALGFFAMGPYLALRSLNSDVTDDDVAEGGRGVFESKFLGGGMLAFATYLLYYVTTQGDIGQQLDGFIQLFSTSTLAHVSTIDLTILSLAMWDPLREDRARRVAEKDEYSFPAAWKFCALPVFGPVFYLLSRPKLPST